MAYLEIAEYIINKNKKNPLVDNTLTKKSKNSLKKFDRARNRGIAYAAHHRGAWFRPEYDFDELSIAQDRDSYLSRAISKKVNKLINAGFEYVGENPESVAYIKRRFAEAEMVTDTPIFALHSMLYADMFRYSNCMLVKVRKQASSSGKKRKNLNGKELEPVAGYFVLPFETLEFKANKNGSLKKVKQITPEGDEKEFLPEDVIHFYANRKPGFTVGTPELLAALDDIQLLRRIEENVEELIETNLFPVYHYKIGSDTMPERMTQDGVPESEIVKRTVEYMPAAGVYVSDHRHEIQAVGSEGRALRIDFYLTYFKNRVFSALGISPVDMGEGSSANRSTASTMSKAMLMDIEAMAKLLEAFINFYMINELLLEGGYDPLDESQKVSIRFGIIDKDEKRADENHIIQTFTQSVRDMDEVRKAIGEKPWKEEQYDKTYQKMFAEPLALVKSMAAGSAASEVLASLPVSNISKEALAKEEKRAKEMAESAAQKPGPVGGVSNGSAKSATARNRPSNQHGTRATAKTNEDENIIKLSAKDNSAVAIVEINPEWSAKELERRIDFVQSQYDMLKQKDVSLQFIADLTFN